jgi:hypothetical protein
VISSVPLNSGNQKLFAVKGGNRTHSGGHRGRGETKTVVVCMSANGSSCFCIKESTEGFDFN